MASTFILDIETIANSALVDHLPAMEVKVGNLKDPAKIAEKEAEAKRRQIEGMALSPLWGRVCAYTLAEDENTCFVEVLREESDAAETELLETLFDCIRRNVSHLVTFNGNRFDLPFIYKRAIVLGIDTRQYGLPALRDLTDRWSDWHTDIMQAWCAWGEYESLDNIAGQVLRDHKLEVDFDQFPEMLKSEEGRKQLAEYCRKDVMLTVRLYNRFAGILF